VSGIDGVPVFLSASFPSDDERGRRFPADPGVIADAVAAIARALLHAGARIVCGGHPTITPLLLFVCDQNGWHDRLVVYQTEFFRPLIPRETWRLAEEGYGDLRFTPTSADRDADLATMRERMLDETEPRAAVFIGGMEGIEREFELARARDIACFPIAASGGAAARLEPGAHSDLLESGAFPLVGRQLVRVIRDSL
jgi:hypothetical protein